jgi:two-component system nitrate/nitrite response regulator NarL
MDGKLLAREKDVARLLVKGVSNKEIARALGVEVVTVKKHVGNICRKLGARNRTQAALVLAHGGGPEGA